MRTFFARSFTALVVDRLFTRWLSDVGELTVNARLPMRASRRAHKPSRFAEREGDTRPRPVNGIDGAQDERHLSECTVSAPKSAVWRVGPGVGSVFRSSQRCHAPTVAQGLTARFGARGVSH